MEQNFDILKSNPPGKLSFWGEAVKTSRQAVYFSCHEDKEGVIAWALEHVMKQIRAAFSGNSAFNKYIWKRDFGNHRKRPRLTRSKVIVFVRNWFDENLPLDIRDEERRPTSLPSIDFLKERFGDRYPWKSVDLHLVRRAIKSALLKFILDGFGLRRLFGRRKFFRKEISAIFSRFWQASAGSYLRTTPDYRNPKTYILDAIQEKLSEDPSFAEIIASSFGGRKRLIARWE